MQDQGAPKQPEFVFDYLLYLLAASSEKASEQFHDQVRARGLRVPEWRVLACLADTDGMMITRLASLSLLEQSRMTRIIAQMENKNLVRRTVDTADKRRVRVQLTDKGREVADRLVAEAKTHEAALLSSLADTDAARIKGVLRVLLNRLEET